MGKPTWVYLIAVAENVFLIGGCAYLVFWRGASPWWFLLAVTLLNTVKSVNTTKED